MEPDPAFSDTNLDKAATEVVGYMGKQGIAEVQHYGPPRQESEDHNSQWNERSSAFGPVS
jgi:hypothetical protein